MGGFRCMRLYIASGFGFYFILDLFVNIFGFLFFGFMEFLGFGGVLFCMYKIQSCDI